MDGALLKKVVYSHELNKRLLLHFGVGAEVMSAAWPALPGSMHRALLIMPSITLTHDPER